MNFKRRGEGYKGKDETVKKNTCSSKLIGEKRKKQGLKIAREAGFGKGVGRNHSRPEYGGDS